MTVLKRATPLACAILIGLGGVAAAQTSGTAPGPDTQHGPAQEGGRTKASPGGSGGGMPYDTTGTRPNVGPGTAPGPNTQLGPAQEGGRTQASPGGSGGGMPSDTTGSITPRSGTAPGQDPHKGPAQEGGRTQASPGPSR